MTADSLAKVLHLDVDAELTKSQIDHIVLEKLGIAVPATVLSSMFEECDVDHGGTVSLAELDAFIDKIKGPNQKERTRYVRKTFWTTVSVYPAFMFLTAQIMSFALNIRSRFGDLKNNSFSYSGFQAILFTIGCYVFVELAREGVVANLQLLETAKDKIVSLVRKIEARDSSATGDDKTTDRDKEMQPIEFFKLLEKDGLFLPYVTFESIFKEIDTDGSGVLSFNEIKAYADAREEAGKLSPCMFQLVVLKECFLSLSYWVGWGWVIACALWLLAAYSWHHGWWSGSTNGHLDGICAIMFLVCAVIGHYFHYQATSTFLGYAEEIERVFLSMVADTESKMKGGSTDDAVRELFKSLDVHGADGGAEVSDGNLDFIELYDALTRFGFVVDLKSLRYLFSHADKSGDGELQMDEFVDCIRASSKHSEQSATQRFFEILKIMVASVQFWMTNMQTMGGIAVVVGAYADIGGKHLTNWYLVSTICWATPGIYGMYQTLKGIRETYDLEATSKWNFKNAFRSGQNDPEKQ